MIRTRPPAVTVLGLTITSGLRSTGTKFNASPASVQDANNAARLASLTPQQFKVLVRVAEGQLNKQIADALGISLRTVKAHMTALFEKLDVRNRTQASGLLRSLQLADPARHVAQD